METLVGTSDVQLRFVRGTYSISLKLANLLQYCQHSGFIVEMM